MQGCKKFRCKKKKKMIDQFLTNQIEKASKIVPSFSFMDNAIIKLRMQWLAKILTIIGSVKENIKIIFFLNKF